MPLADIRSGKHQKCPPSRLRPLGREKAETHECLRENPILTTIDTTSVKDVPFPAITVDAGKVTNSWGFMEKAMDLLDFECYDDAYNCTNSTSLRQDFSGLFKAVAERWQLEPASYRLEPVAYRQLAAVAHQPDREAAGGRQ